ncbi:MAG TPA: GNAT family N-acetyltransferase [Armatimonadota bacterium]|jgi:CelD/BcsL family acetyltransferase involved in cellulose biosynthesis
MASTLASCDNWEALPWRGAVDAPLRDAWDYLIALDTDAPLYRHCRWFELACESGAIIPWGIVIVRAGGRPIGLFPLRKRTPWTWETITYFSEGEPQIVLDRKQEREAWDGLLGWLRKQRGAAMLAIGSSADQQQTAHIRRACEAEGLYLHKKIERLPMVWSRLPESWEAFLATSAPSARKDILRAERMLYRDYPEVTMEHLTDEPAALEALDEMIAMYRQRWCHQVGGCCFDDPRNVTFYRAAIRWALRQGAATVSRLRLGEETVVVTTMFHVPGHRTLYEQFVGRNHQVMPNRYSPGLVECNHTTRWAIARGFRRVNLGLGSSHYKMMYAGEESPYYELVVARSPRSQAILSRLDRLLYLAKRLPLHMQYHLRHLLHPDRPTQLF